MLRKGRDSGIGVVVSKACSLDLSAQALLENLKASDAFVLPNQKDSGPATGPVVPKAVRAVPTIA